MTAPSTVRRAVPAIFVCFMKNTLISPAVSAWRHHGCKGDFDDPIAYADLLRGHHPLDMIFERRKLLTDRRRYACCWLADPCRKLRRLDDVGYRCAAGDIGNRLACQA